MSKRIIIIGGGELGDNETLSIDQYIAKSAGIDHPRLLFIPTASFDALGYVEVVEKIYGEQLGCEVSALLLMSESMSHEKAAEAIYSADIIYVGGGSTMHLMKVWKQYGVDELLKEAYNRGIVLSGISAGSICWFEHGHSDSVTYETGTESPFICVEALGILPGVHCPHHNDGRQEDFDRMISEMGKVGIALEDFAAMEVRDDQYRILKSRAEAQALKVWVKDGQVVREPLDNTEVYLPLSALYDNK